MRKALLVLPIAAAAVIGYRVAYRAAMAWGRRWDRSIDDALDAIYAGV